MLVESRHPAPKLSHAWSTSPSASCAGAFACCAMSGMRHLYGHPGGWFASWSTPCQIMSRGLLIPHAEYVTHAVPCWDMLCHALPCCAMLCDAAPCCAVLMTLWPDSPFCHPRWILQHPRQCVTTWSPSQLHQRCLDSPALSSLYQHGL